MEEGLREKAVAYWARLSEKINYPRLRLVTNAVNVLLLLLMMLSESIIRISDSSSQLKFRALFNILKGRDPQGELLDPVSVVNSIACVLVLICLGFYLGLSSTTITVVSTANTLERVCVYSPAVLIVLAQVLYCPLSWFTLGSLSRINSHPGLVIIAKVLNLIFVTIVTLCGFKTRLYGPVLVLVAALVQLPNSILAAAVCSILSLVFIILQHNQIQRAFYWGLLFIEALLINNMVEDSWKISTMIFVGICLVLVTTSVVFKHFVAPSLQETGQNNLRLLQIHSRLDQKNPYLSLKSSQKFYIEMVLRNFLDENTKFLNDEDILHFNAKVSQEQFYADLTKKIDVKMKTEAQTNTGNLGFLQNWFSFRINSKYKFRETLDTITQYMGVLRTSEKVSVNQLYLKKSIELEVATHNSQSTINTRQMSLEVSANQIYYSYLVDLSQAIQMLGAIFSLLAQERIDYFLIEKTIVKLEERVSKIAIQLSELKQTYVWQAQAQIYFDFIALYQPFCSMGTPQIRQDKAELSMLYFVLRGPVIVSASLNLARRLNITLDELAQHPISKIGPKQFTGPSPSQQQLIQQNGLSTFLVPVVTDMATIQVYDGTAHLMLSCTEGIQYFIQLAPHPLQPRSMFIYVNSVDATLQYASKQFFREFGGDSAWLQEKMRSRAFFVSEAVNDMDDQEILEALASGEDLICEFKLTESSSTNLSVTANQRIKNLASMSLVSKFQNCFLVLIIFKSQTQPETISKIPTHSTISRLKHLGLSYVKNAKSSEVQQPHKQQTPQPDKQQSLVAPEAAKFSDYSFKDKAQQQLITIATESESNYCNYTCMIYFIAVLVLVVLISLPVIIWRHSQEKKLVLDQCIDFLQKSTNLSTNLVHASFQVFYQYLLAENREYFTDFIAQSPLNTQSIDFDQVMQGLNLHIGELLDMFKQGFISFQLRKNLPQAYQLVYGGFTTAADFAKTNLIDYIYNIKLASEDVREHLVELASTGDPAPKSALSFLARNYPRIAALQAPFNALDQLRVLPDHLLLILQIQLGALSGLFLTLLLLIWYLIRGQTNLARKMSQVFAICPRQIFGMRKQKLDKLYAKFLSQAPKDIISIAEKADSNNERDKQYSIALHNSENNPKSSKKIKVKEQRSAYDGNKVSSGLSSLIKMKMLLLFCALYYSLIGCLVYLSEMFRTVDQNTLELYNQIERLKYRKHQDSADIMHSYIVTQVLKAANPTAAPPSSFQKESSVDGHILSEYGQWFENFFNTKDVILKQNLCDGVFETNEALYELIRCERVSFGIMAQGLVQSSEILDILTVQIARGQKTLMGLSQGGYPNMLVSLYMKTRIVGQFDRIRQALLSNKAALTEHQGFAFRCLAAGCFVVGVAIAGYAVLSFFPAVLQGRKVALAYLKLMSREILQDAQVCAYISDQKLLDRTKTL